MSIRRSRSYRAQEGKNNCLRLWRRRFHGHASGLLAEILRLRSQFLHLCLDELGLEISHPPDTKNPIVSGFSGLKKFDLFFQRGSKNIENEMIEFEDCYKNSILKKDLKENVSFRIPSIDDLISLKKIRKPNVKDEQDIEYLLKAKSLFRKAKNK